MDSQREEKLMAEDRERLSELVRQDVHASAWAEEMEMMFSPEYAERQGLEKV